MPLWAMKRTNTPGCFAGRTDTLPSLLPDIRYSLDQPGETGKIKEKGNKGKKGKLGKKGKIGNERLRRNGMMCCREEEERRGSR
jgi:hypothetical protein